MFHLYLHIIIQTYLTFIDIHRKIKDLIPEYKITNIIYQIINGINYLHLKGFMYRDLKP